MLRILRFCLALTTLITLAVVCSCDRKNIRARFVIYLIVAEIFSGYFFLHSQIGLSYVQNVSSLFSRLLTFSSEGTSFVFGNMNKQGLAFFFLNALCPAIFISALIGILQYIHVLPLVIRIVGTALSKINGMGKLESFNAVSSLILGQSENFIAYKDILEKISERRMYTMAATAMSTVSMSIVGVYMTMLIPKYIVAALVLNMFSTFIILSLLNPYQTEQDEDLQVNFIHTKKNFFEMLEEYILAGFKITIVITAMLIGFISLIAAINSLFCFLFGIDFQRVLGYIFFPFAWLIGISLNEALQVGNIMAIKLVSNEFLAMISLEKIATELSPRSLGIISVFLVSFSNFSSIGVVSGAIRGVNETQGNVVSRYGLKLVYSSTLVSMLSSAIAGLVI